MYRMPNGRWRCRPCQAVRDKNRDKEKKKTYTQEYQNTHKEQRIAAAHASYQRNKEKVKVRTSAYAKEHREYRSAQVKDRLRSDPIFKLMHSMRTRTRALIYNKSQHTLELLGCNGVEFAAYLETKFTPEMNWSNHGKLWHIDHIVPLSWFDLTDKEQQKQAFHYTNCQPMLAKDNLSKGNRHA